MVGVPGRSKACVTCLKRKKRCDMEKPFCGTCRKARVECGGYHRPRIFINNTMEDHNKQLVEKERGPSRRVGDRNRSSSSGSDVALLTSLAKSAYQVKYMDLFWRLYLPNGQKLSAEVTRLALGGWIDAIQDLHGKETVLEKALLAMSVTAVARQEGDSFLKEEGRRLYGRALQSASAAMKDPRRATSDGVLTAVRLFSFYEALFGQTTIAKEQTRSWQVHNEGDIALMTARSPYTFISGYAHELFSDGRANLAMSYLRRRKRIFLIEPEWKIIPWLEREKNPRDRLVDVLVDMTALFEDTDLMKACEDRYEKEYLRQQVTDGFIQLQQDLLAWQSLFAPDFRPFTELPGDVPAYELAGAHLMTMFWATAIVVSSNLGALCVPPGEEQDFGWDLDEFCGNIVRTIPFFCHPSMGLFRAHVITYPLTVALHYICAAGPTRLAEERRILADCLYDPACAGVRQFIASTKEEYAQEFLK
ncbi:Zn(II)2Cys6 transcription factor domain-containing protein [Aspergillus lucknowensis]|uniref:Zn(2)-C6 fungal-type domain-containing protein n=1 Tax=Aspergillus lucknowensis TaxID=176173 RepID=A0ABR4LZM2_9EURO